MNAICTADEYLPGLVIQGFQPPLKWTSFKAMAFDMDSTLINIECIDEIADAAGKKDAVSAITEATMRGEIVDFSESLRRRVSMLKGVPEEILHEVIKERLQLNIGAQSLLQTARQAGLKTILVSGGFTVFSDVVKDMLQIDEAYANTLGIENGLLTGEVIGPVVDGAAKRQHVLSLCERLGCTPSQVIAVGDGANDLPMMSIAGISVAYMAKPKVRDQAMVSINAGGLDRLLELF